MGYKGEVGVKNLKKWVILFMDILDKNSTHQIINSCAFFSVKTCDLNTNDYT